MNSNTTMENLPESKITYGSWLVSLFGIPIYAYCLHFVLRIMKLNPYIKAIFTILILHYLLGYILIFVSLILILPFEIQNFSTCAMLTFPLTNSGCILQIISALISLLRFYMGTKTAKNRMYNTKVVITAIFVTVSVYLVFGILLYSFSTPLMLSKCMNQEIPKISFVPITMMVLILSATISGISADIGKFQSYLHISGCLCHVTPHFIL